MTLFECKLCGGALKFNSSGIVVCDHCGLQQTLPGKFDEQRAAAFNYGNNFRRSGEFDKALTIYKRIVRKDDIDAEGYWCCALSRFGIEYRKDPDTGENLPICHRASYESFLDDASYKAALAYSSGALREQYQKDGEKIAGIQRGILEIAQKEESCDIFICCKETDEDGNPTRDAALAQELCNRLTEEERKVFFAPAALGEVPDSQREPYIFAALNSAKIMILIGTKPEHLNAAWVKNEWSRFLALTKKDPEKQLLPCYRGMSPEELPERLQGLRSYNMDEFSFLEDLCRGISAAPEIRQLPVPEKQTAPLLKRISLFLEDGDWQRADVYCEKVLDIAPDCAEAYLGKLMAELRVPTQDKLKYCAKPLEDNENYQKILHFADESLLDVVTGYNDAIYARDVDPQLKSDYQDAVYSDAVKLMAGAGIEELQEAIRMFETIIDWKDSCEQIDNCKKRIEELTAPEASKVQEEPIAEPLELPPEEAPVIKENKKKPHGMIMAIACGVVVIGLVLGVFLGSNSKHKDSARLEEPEKYTEAAMEVPTEAPTEAPAKPEITEPPSVWGVVTADNLNVRAEPHITGEVVERLAVDSRVEILEQRVVDGLAWGRTDAGWISMNFVSIGDEIVETPAPVQEKQPDTKKTETPNINTEMAAIRAAGIGDIVRFGVYEQDNDLTNGKEAIEWQVLDIQDGRALVISKYGLEMKKFNQFNDNEGTWETSDMRAWLNTNFVDSAFTAEEKSRIATVKVVDCGNPFYPRYGENDTWDQVFLLSLQEVYDYFDSDEQRQLKPTPYAVETEAHVDKTNGNTWWWLRTFGVSRPAAIFVYTDGSVSVEGTFTSNHGRVIRPAMWIELG